MGTAGVEPSALAGVEERKAELDRQSGRADTHCRCRRFSLSSPHLFVISPASV